MAAACRVLHQSAGYALFTHALWRIPEEYLCSYTQGNAQIRRVCKYQRSFVEVWGSGAAEALSPSQDTVQIVDDVAVVHMGEWL